MVIQRNEPERRRKPSLSEEGIGCPLTGHYEKLVNL